MNRSKLQTKLEQAKKDREAIEKNIQELQNVLDGRLKEWDVIEWISLWSPKRGSVGRKRIVIRKNGGLVAVDKNGTVCNSNESGIKDNIECGNYKVLYNVFEGVLNVKG